MDVSRATPIFLHSIKLSNHNFSRGKFFLLFFKNILTLFCVGDESGMHKDGASNIAQNK